MSRWTRVALTAFISLLFISMRMAQAAAPAPNASPVNPHSSPEARALLKYFYSISGKYILSGQHNYPNHISRWSDRANDFAGKYPVIFGQDFGFSGGEDKDSVEARPALIAEVERQWRSGAIPTLTWHCVRPSSDEPVTFRENVQSDISDFEWNELLTPGTALHARWIQQVDVIAGFLRQLRDAHVPVLFRPYHEMNGNWFWWGGRPGKNGSAALYRQIFDRFVNVHHLDNLIWVWNVNSPSTNAGPYVDYFPGADFVDIVTVDNYQPFVQSYYDDALAIAGTKPVALGEVGALPSVEVLKAQPKWTYFMVWSEFVEFANPLDKVREVYGAPTTLTRDDPRVAAPLAGIRKASSVTGLEPVSANASSQAKALLARIVEASGKGVLSGQDNSVQGITGALDQVLQATTKYPIVYGEDLGVTKDAGVEVAAARQAIVEEAKRQNQNKAVISLTWRPGRPTDDEPAGFKDSVSGKLSDFEWEELLTPGTHLNQRWAGQVDSVAASLKQLQEAGVAVLWSPYPQLNSKKFWWAGRKGVRGSSALYRQLFDRLTGHGGLHNLVWVWDTAPPGEPNAEGTYNDFFPGHLYVDAMALHLDGPNMPWSADTFLGVFATGKPIGLRMDGTVPSSDWFTQSKWAWFQVSPLTAPGDPAGVAEQNEAMRKLYSDPRVLSREGPAAPPNIQ